MREKQVLQDLYDILVLYQYLYMDSANKIVINNGMTDLEIRLDENLEFFCKNLSFPDLPETHHSCHMTLNYCLGAIELLKNQKSQQYPHAYGFEWDVIKALTSSTMALTFPQKRRNP